MNPSFKNLTAIAGKRSRTIIGLMSGTSLDGLDIALCRISGSGADTAVHLIKFCTKKYAAELRERLRSISSVKLADMQELCKQHTGLAAYHAELILEALSEWETEPEDVDCIASHGQTVYHLPARVQRHGIKSLNSTLQIGDGDQIAARTGILTISDFRQKHTAHGGEGAPMAALVDRILFGDEKESRILLNIGGIANYTWIPAERQGEYDSFTTDTGPGNTLIDTLSNRYFQKMFDKEGLLAASGKINRDLLDALFSDPWFNESAPKSTGPEYFHYAWMAVRAEQAGLSLNKIPPVDQLATVTELTARTIAQNIRENVPEYEECAIYVSGGGAHNGYLVSRMKEHVVNTTVHDFSELGFDPDAKEAMIFAVLANEMLAGEGFDFERGDGSIQKLNFGKISFPL
ncbi:anhydro-N-acetylmuramic acid kinase [Rhodohalobacter mucosus]|uniref:Anhydro-N-acetylmuramic acid kinase n=1 Tax=Rhodohalobacter mucosus TaxID=2079485 RepID=A0A316TUG7_9BACT|nr:anhydro-N-acetylmuramic acid kinase [Rhodohalobacter mucosus]PWN08080.1 anhydro-N-acetylmuramic acid kinase [Rhodohalobacter mucosus]